MTRKDYVKAAKIVSAARVRYPWAVGDYRKEVVDYFERELADMFASDNPKFNRQIFAKACEVQDGE
jgi:hypothetical protein